MTLSELKHTYELVFTGQKYPCGVTVQPQIELFIKDKIRSYETDGQCFYGVEIYTVAKQEESVRIWHNRDAMMNYIKKTEAPNDQET